MPTLFGLQNPDGTFVFEEAQRFQHTHSIETVDWPPTEISPMACVHPDASKINGSWLCSTCNAPVVSTGWITK